MDNDEWGGDRKYVRRRAYKRWSAWELDLLKTLACEGVCGRDAAAFLGRSNGAVQQKAALLALSFDWSNRRTMHRVQLRGVDINNGYVRGSAQ